MPHATFNVLQRFMKPGKLRHKSRVCRRLIRLGDDLLNRQRNPGLITGNWEPLRGRSRVETGPYSCAATSAHICNVKLQLLRLLETYSNTSHEPRRVFSVSVILFHRWRNDAFHKTAKNKKGCLPWTQRRSSVQKLAVLVGAEESHPDFRHHLQNKMKFY